MAPSAEPETCIVAGIGGCPGSFDAVVTNCRKAANRCSVCGLPRVAAPFFASNLGQRDPKRIFPNNVVNRVESGKALQNGRLACPMGINALAALPKN